jgi:hypothetical protein
MQPAAIPTRPGPALCVYLCAFGGGVLGLLGVRSPETTPAPARREQATAAASASRALARAQALSGALTVLLGLTCLWVLAGDGLAFEVRGVEVSLRNLRNPTKAALLCSIVWVCLRDLRSGAWRAPRVLQRAGRLKLSARLGIVVWCALAAAQLPVLDRVGECLDVQAARAAGGNGSTLFTNEWHLHLRSLIAQVAARPSEPPVALVIEDVNPRGHLDSFYAYPRLLRMQPDLHAWALGEMMGRGGEHDPAFAAPGDAPPLEQSLRWAAERGYELLLARPQVVEPLAARVAR